MPSLVFYTILFHLGSNSSHLDGQVRWNVVGLIFIATCLVPILIVIIFRLTKLIKDLHMENREERYLPFISILLFYFVLLFTAQQQEWINPLLNVTFRAIVMVILATTMITFSWKISTHTAGVAGWLGFIIALQYRFEVEIAGALFGPLIVVLILTGIVAWARLYLNAHKPSEVLAGALLGFVICFGYITLIL